MTRNWYGGLEVVRIAAVAAVAVQHLLAVSDFPTPAIFFSLDLGQIGVATFCSISGFLVFAGHEERPLAWLMRRLNRIYIPFWMAVVAVFCANFWVPYKPVTLSLFLAEMSGWGYFFYPTQLLGVHFWFISLILVCYSLAFIIRATPRLTPLLAAVSLIAVYTTHPQIGGNVVAFLCAMGVAKSKATGRLGMGIILGSCVLAVWHHAWAYVAAGTIALLFGLLVPLRPPGIVHAMSLMSYEFYLVHAPIYLSLRKVAHLGIVANAVIGTLLSVVAAWLLGKATGWAFQIPVYWRLLRRRLRQHN